MKRLIAIAMLAACAQQPAPAKPRSTDHTARDAMIGAAVVAGVMFIALAVPCENCTFGSASAVPPTH
jgi:hypothetical protein